jgi:hypothetical protein
LRRLLDSSKEPGHPARHAATMRISRPDAATAEPRTSEFIIEKDLESLGVQTIWLNSFACIPAFLQSIKK